MDKIKIKTFKFVRNANVTKQKCCENPLTNLNRKH